MNSEYRYTALDAGLIDMPPISPPTATNALPIATLLAVPSAYCSENLNASYAFWAYRPAAANIAAPANINFLNMTFFF